MAKEFALSFYNSERWRRCRQAYIDERMLIDGGKCEECHKRLGLIVHHRMHLTSENITDPEITLGFENLELVCKDCHDMFEGHGLGTGGILPRIRFDADGQPVVR